MMRAFLHEGQSRGGRNQTFDPGFAVKARMFSLRHTQVLAKRNDLEAENITGTEEGTEKCGGTLGKVKSWPRVYSIGAHNCACFNLLNTLPHRPLATRQLARLLQAKCKLLQKQISYFSLVSVEARAIPLHQTAPPESVDPHPFSASAPCARGRQTYQGQNPQSKMDNR